MNNVGHGQVISVISVAPHFLSFFGLSKNNTCIYIGLRNSTLHQLLKNSLILVSPKSVISRPPEKKFDTSCVIKADTLRTQIDQQVDKRNPLADLVTISKVCTSSTLMETARALAGFHTPKRVNFRARFGLPVQKDRPKN
jgi:hypothetical protein